MTSTVEIRDDPDHTEGGHALVLFCDIPGPTGAATLVIEPLTEGFDYRGPQQIEVIGRSSDRGLEVAIGPDVVSALPPGIAMNLALAGTGIDADILWPTLTQRRAEPKRRAFQSGASRRVVVESAGRVAQPEGTPGAPLRSSAEVLEPKPVVTPRAIDAVLASGADPIDVRTTGEQSAGATREAGASEQDSDPDPRPAKISVVEPPKPGWRPPAAAVAVVAFMAGAATTGAIWFMRPGPVATVTADAALPSPYEMLNTLSDRSPRGTHVELGDWTAFRGRGRASKTSDETSFWHKWATRSLLEAKTNDAAATLSDFATDLAKGHVDQPGLAAARFLWEMAALAKDCAAMDNIATAMALDDRAGAAEQVTLWHNRARQCRDRSMPGH